MYNLILNTHVWTSALFLLVSLVLSFLVVKGFFKNKKYTRTIIYLENAFIILLYLGLVLGFILYFFMEPANKYEIHSMEQVNHILSLRFWSVEHFSVMLFALILAQIGKVFTSKSIGDHAKFRYALIYYGSATLATLISLSFYMAYK